MPVPTLRASLRPHDWEPLDLELVRDGFLARVTRTLHVGAHRWRWAVTPVEVVQRRASQPVEHAYARGYAYGAERAIEMAEAALVALKKAMDQAPSSKRKRSAARPPTQSKKNARQG